MRQLIGQVRSAIPFGLSEEQICASGCQGCSAKLLAFLESELEHWEMRLEAGERPNFGDLSRLAKTSRKVHKVLQQNGLVKSP
jgi:hypothetical protein